MSNNSEIELSIKELNEMSKSDLAKHIHELYYENKVLRFQISVLADIINNGRKHRRFIKSFDNYVQEAFQKHTERRKKEWLAKNI